MAVDWLSVEDLKAYCRDEIPTDNDEHYEDAIDAAVGLLQRDTNRVFTIAGDTATARVYRPYRDRRLLFIDDCTEITSVVENGATLTVGVGYQAEPLNGLTFSGESSPYHTLRRLSACWYTDDDKATVSVTAKWGWSSIPPLVLSATKILAKDILSTRQVSFGLVAVTESAGITARTNPIVRACVEKFHLAKAPGGVG